MGNIIGNIGTMGSIIKDYVWTTFLGTVRDIIRDHVGTIGNAGAY